MTILIRSYAHSVMQEWVGVGGISKQAATFNHVGGSFNLFMATTGDDWIIPSFRNWGYMLHVEHMCWLETVGHFDQVLMCQLCYAGLGISPHYARRYLCRKQSQAIDSCNPDCKVIHNCFKIFYLSTHCTLMTPYDTTHLGQHWHRWWLVACLVPSHYWISDGLWIIWTLGTNFTEIWKYNSVTLRKFVWKSWLQNGGHYVFASMCSTQLKDMCENGWWDSEKSHGTLTHLPWTKWLPFCISNAFSWMKKFDFWLKFNWSWCLRVQLIIIQHLFR